MVKVNLLIIMSLLSYFILSCNQNEASGGTEPPPSPTPIVWAGKTNVFMGNSITFGVGASSNAARWTTVLSTTKGSAETNMGQSSMVLQLGDTCERPTLDYANIPTHTSSHLFLFIALGVNDIGVHTGNSGFSFANFQSRLEGFVDAAVAKGWTANRVVILNPFYFLQKGREVYVGQCGVTVAADQTVVDGYNTAAQAAATAKGTKFADVHSVMKNYPNADLFFDSMGIHPDDTLHGVIADYLAELEALNFDD